MKIKRTGILLFAIMLLLTGCGRGSTAANDESFVGQISEMDLQDAGLGEEEAASETVNAADEETETEMAAEAVTDETAEEDAAAGMAEPGTGAETAAGETEGVSLENVDWEGLAIKRGDLFYPFDSVSVYGKYGIWADEEDQILILSKSGGDELVTFEDVPYYEYEPVEKYYCVPMKFAEDMEGLRVDDMQEEPRDLVMERGSIVEEVREGDLLTAYELVNGRLIGDKDQVYTLGYYEGTAYKEVEVSCNAICFYNDEAFMTGSWDTLQVIKTREGYFQVDYSVLEPGYYRMDHKIFQVVE